MARLSRRLWGGTSLKTAAKEAIRDRTTGPHQSRSGTKLRNAIICQRISMSFE